MMTRKSGTAISPLFAEPVTYAMHAMCHYNATISSKYVTVPRGGFRGVSRVSGNPFWCGLNSRLTEKG